MDEVNAKAFGQRVISAGSLIGSTAHPVVIQVDPSDVSDNRLDIELSFEDDASKQQGLQLGGGDERLTVRMINYNNAIGTSFKEPIEVASNKTSVLSLMIVVYAVQNIRTINYLLLSRDKKVSNGDVS